MQVPEQLFDFIATGIKDFKVGYYSLMSKSAPLCFSFHLVFVIVLLLHVHDFEDVWFHNSVDNAFAIISESAAALPVLQNSRI